MIKIVCSVAILAAMFVSCKEGDASISENNLEKIQKNGEAAKGESSLSLDDKAQKGQRGQASRGDSLVHQKRLDSIPIPKGLVDIRSVDPTIKVDLKYATSDNFMGKVLYYKLKKALVQGDVAIRLAKAQQELKSLHPTYSLLIYDAARPVSVQQKMWDALDSIPPKERGKFVSNPANRSLHNFGAAVDITIVDGNGKPLDMGAGYDDIRKIAYPSLESKFLASGELTAKQVENRKLLRAVMSSQGFKNIPTEWWHFNACSRDEAKRKYEALMQEPTI